MDIKKEATQFNKEAKPVKPAGESFIRTMAKDMAALERKALAARAKEVPGGAKKVAPPASLPVLEPAKKPERPPKPPKPPKSLKPTKAIIPKAPLPKPRLKFALIGLGIVIVIGGAGGFLYWWNYLRPIPPAATHYECRDLQCVSIEGEGEDRCQTNEDCQPVAPVEPIVPDSLIAVDETETIELTIGQESLLVDKLKSAAAREQPLNTFKRILVKLVNQTDKHYADLGVLISSLGASLPENVSLEENYTLFFYSQLEGNRLGLVIDTEENLNEETIVDDLKPLLLKDETLAPFTKEFQDNAYQDIAIRYINFPNPDLSIDYAVVGDKLVIATSRESMYAVIDALLKDIEIITPCDGMDCFNDKFAQCKPAIVTSKLTDTIIYYYEIIGSKDNLCEVKSKFIANPNPDWVEKEMICQYDNSKDFETAIQDMSNCQGPLYDLMTGN